MICMGLQIMAHRADILSQLTDLSHRLGRESDGLVILAEGNTSAKVDDETFYVKASGANLATIDGSGLVECRFAPLLDLLTGPDRSDAEIETALLACRTDPAAPKPSVEAVFHAQLLSLPEVKFVGHTHPLNVNGVLCSDRVDAFAAGRRFPDEIVCCGARSAVVPYVDPGVTLARQIAATVDSYLQTDRTWPRVILLRNHGMIAPAATPAGVIAATLMAEKSAAIFLRAESIGGAISLPIEQVARIADRPDEHYRRRKLKM